MANSQGYKEFINKKYFDIYYRLLAIGYTLYAISRYKKFPGREP